MPLSSDQFTITTDETTGRSVVKVRDNQQFEYGERFITCQRCKTKRPREAVEVKPDDCVACKDERWCYKNGG